MFVRCLAGILVLPFLAIAPPAEAAKESLGTRLDKGEIIVTATKLKGASVPKFTVMGVVDAPMAKVWKLVTECDGYVRVMPRVEAAKVVKRKGKTVHCKIRVDLPFPLGHLDSVTAATASTQGASRRLDWKLIKGDYRWNQGQWKLTEFGTKNKKRTLIVYNALVVPKIALPDGMLRNGQRRELPALIKGLRTHAKAPPRSK